MTHNVFGGTVNLAIPIYPQTRAKLWKMRCLAVSKNPLQYSQIRIQKHMTPKI